MQKVKPQATSLKRPALKARTVRALAEARRGGLRRFAYLKDLMVDLKGKI